MFCSECGAAQAASARFCGHCGHRLAEQTAATVVAATQAIEVEPEPRFCGSCYAELEPDQVFCSECGQRAAKPLTPAPPPVPAAEPATVAAPVQRTVPTAGTPSAPPTVPVTAAATTMPRVSAPPMTPAPYAPPGLTGPRMASFGARLVARCIDGVVIVVVLLVAGLIATLVGSLVLNSTGVLGAVILAALLYGAVEFVILAIIRIGGEGNRPGQTLGKAAAGIRVVRETDGSRAGYGPAFGRFFINLVPVLGLLSCLSMLWTPDKRCWHDMWTGTGVEKSPVPAAARGNRWHPAILATCLALVISLGTVGLSGYLARNSTYPVATDTSGFSSGSGGYGGSGAGGYGGGAAGSGGGAAPIPNFSSTPAPPTPESYRDVLTIGTAAQSEPEEQDVADLLDRYFTAINTRNYSGYTATQAADIRADMDESQFQDGYASTTDSDATLVDIVDTPNGGRGAQLTFTSNQDAADGPDGQSCTDWTLTYALVTEGGSWKLDGIVDGTDHSHTACG
jgi:uncharacterized RDD family membrane protein YckC